MDTLNNFVKDLTGKDMAPDLMAEYLKLTKPPGPNEKILSNDFPAEFGLLFSFFMAAKSLAWEARKSTHTHLETLPLLTLLLAMDHVFWGLLRNRGDELNVEYLGLRIYNGKIVLVTWEYEG